MWRRAAAGRAHLGSAASRACNAKQQVRWTARLECVAVDYRSHPTPAWSPHSQSEETSHLRATGCSWRSCDSCCCTRVVVSFSCIVRVGTFASSASCRGTAREEQCSFDFAGWESRGGGWGRNCLGRPASSSALHGAGACREERCGRQPTSRSGGSLGHVCQCDQRKACVPHEGRVERNSTLAHLFLEKLLALGGCGEGAPTREACVVGLCVALESGRHLAVRLGLQGVG